MGLTGSKQIDYSLEERMMIQISMGVLIDKLESQHWDEFSVLTSMIGESLVMGSDRVITKKMLEQQNNKLEMISGDLDSACAEWNRLGFNDLSTEDYSSVYTLSW